MSQLTKGNTYIRAARAPLPDLFHAFPGVRMIGDAAIGDGRTDAAPGGWVLFIGPGRAQRPEIVEALRGLGFTFAIANDFHEAKRVLSAQPPDLLVTHVRLGEYNGLQLVLRGKMTRPEMAAIVVADAPDPVLARDVAEMNATLVLSSAEREEWTTAVLTAIAQPAEVRG